MEKILSLSGPTLDLAPSVVTERKFQNKCRLYIGNVSSEINEEELLELFKPFGESTELFLNKEKNFAFIRMVRIYFYYCPFSNQIGKGYQPTSKILDC